MKHLHHPRNGISWGYRQFHPKRVWVHHDALRKKPCFKSIYCIKSCHFPLYCKSILASAQMVQLLLAHRVSEERQQVKCILPAYYMVNNFIKQLFPRIMYISSLVNDLSKSNIHLPKCRGVQNRNWHLSHTLFTCNKEEMALLRCCSPYSKVNV